MAFRFFTIPLQHPDEATGELNAFLRAHRIVHIDRQWSGDGERSRWSLCVEYLDGSPPATTQPAGGGSKRAIDRNRTDYKEVLSPEDFAIFAKLRDLRRDISQSEGVPVYAVFTNEQLARMVSSRAISKADVSKIEGVGDARVEKYGSRMVTILASAWKSEVASDETSGKPV